ncbi:hypothetical protein C8F01DRAFT_1375155 [Mycena amicta]|nr:hypothetical protein C8F01DRAFT_1375155 [Mycena amicta]
MATQSRLPRAFQTSLPRHSNIPAPLLQRARDIEDAIAALHAVRDGILGEMRTYAPPSIQDLAPETIGEIFVRAVEDDAYRGPLLLAAVNRHWRNVALATHQLWRTISIGPRDGHVWTPANLTRWISRAAPLPVDVKVAHLNSGCAVLLANHAPSIRTLRFFSPNIMDAAPLNRARDFPKLEVLDVNIHRSGAGGGNSRPAMIFTSLQQTPRLREARIIWILVESLPLPWAQLTTLQLHQMSLAPCLRVLRECIRITTLVLLAFRYRGRPRYPAGAFYAPASSCLLHRQIGTSNGADWIRPRTPALDSLSLCMLTSDTVVYLDGLFQRSRCGLSTLEFDAHSFQGAATFLLRAPYIRHLHLGCTTWDMAQFEKLFRWLAEPDGDIFPHLESLSLESSDRICVPMVLLAKMLRARRLQPGRVGYLNKFSLRGDSSRSFFDSRQALGWLRQLHEEGMVFDFDGVTRFSGEDGMDASKAHEILS